MDVRKSIKFIYYRPCLKNDENTIVKLNAYIEKLQTNLHQEISARSGMNISCNYISCHPANTIQQENLDEFRMIPFEVYELRFPKSRFDIPAKINYTTHELSPVEINTDERIAEETVCLYDPKTDIFIAEVNRNGASITNIENVFNKIVDEEQNYIEFVPMVNSNAFEKALLQKTSYFLNLRLANVGDSDFMLKGKENESVKTIISMANTLSAPQEYAVQAEISLKITEKTKKNGFIREQLNSLLRILHPMTLEGKVDKLNVKGYNISDEKMEELNLIEDIIQDKQVFSISPDDRHISSKSIFRKMIHLYSIKRTQFLRQS